jgi:hypothetical protein
MFAMRSLYYFHFLQVAVDSSCFIYLTDNNPS